jgi:hypothetical protein
LTDPERDTPTERSLTLADLERSFLVMSGADAAFDALSDPVRLPEYVPTLQLVDSVAIEGEADADADLAEREGAPEAGFLADRKTRTMRWSRPERDYHGSIEVAEGTTSTATVTVRLHTGADADDEAVSKAFDQAIANIRRLVTKR